MGLLYGNFNWSIFLAYIVSLQYFLASLMQIGNFISTFSRFYPQAKKYYEFVTDAEKSRYDAENIKLDDSSIYLKASDLNEQDSTVELKSGNITYLYNPKGVNRDLVSVINKNTVSNNGNDKMHFHWFMQNIDFSGMTIRESHGFRHDLDEKTLYHDLNKILDEKDLESITDIKLDNVVIEENNLSLSEKTKSILLLLSAIHSNRKILLFNENDYTRLQNIIGQDLNRILSNRVIIIITNGKKIPKFEDDDTVYLISSSSELVSWCRSGWIVNNLDKFDNLLKSTPSEESLQANILDFDQELEE